MSIQIVGSTFDCRDAATLARFWADVLGYEVAPWAWEEGALIGDPDRSEPWIGFAGVPESKDAKNRFHPDLEADNLDAEVARLESIGARTIEVHREPFWDWNVMVDPEGNEFCLGRFLRP